MTHEIDRLNIFDFLKEAFIVEEISNREHLEIREKEKNAKFEKLILTNLNKHSKYWLINTEAHTFQPQGKKVEKIILELTEDKILNIILIELKSEKVNQTDIDNKFKNSLSWVYILLNLVHQKQKIKVFGILVAQKEVNWNLKSTLKLFSSTAIRYIKRSFYTTENRLTLEIQQLIKGNK